jgi:hypothetical protein
LSKDKWTAAIIHLRRMLSWPQCSFFEEHEHVYKGRFNELRREVMVGYEAAKRGELVDGEVVFENLRAKLVQRRAQASELDSQ